MGSLSGDDTEAVHMAVFAHSLAFTPSSNSISGYLLLRALACTMRVFQDPPALHIRLVLPCPLFSQCANPFPPSLSCLSGKSLGC